MDYHGYEGIEFDFEGFPAKVIFPKKRRKRSALILKTEYFNAFPETELLLLSRGHHLAYIQNKNRWGTPEDLERKARFIRVICGTYSLCGCVPVGMSCGGLFAVKLASEAPERISCLYLDAPVINYMSCPCGFGKGQRFDPDHEEIRAALGLGSTAELLAYRDMPLDRLPRLIEHRIPVVMVAGDSDTVVPYDENGAFLEKAYRENGIDIEVYIKKGCDHHPHGLEDPGMIAEFIERYV